MFISFISWLKLINMVGYQIKLTLILIKQAKVNFLGISFQKIKKKNSG